jgi:molecular chaperone GrpE (heat shock protein)
MRDLVAPRVSKWPFFIGYALLLGTACIIYAISEKPVAFGPMAVAVLCVAASTAFGVVPFWLDYRVVSRVAEAAGLETVLSQVQKLEELSADIRHATSLWQTVQEQADKTAAAAESITSRMTGELKSFSEFMQRANDAEKANLRLEVEKLRRVEGDWLGILVRILDHVYALHQAGRRSGQPSLVEQLTLFQNACLDVARRVGLAPFSASPDEPFDTQRHRTMDADGKAPEGAVVTETVATGYTFQGQFLRPALVRARDPKSAPSPPSPTPGPEAPGQGAEAAVSGPEPAVQAPEGTVEGPAGEDQFPLLPEAGPAEAEPPAPAQPAG